MQRFKKLMNEDTDIMSEIQDVLDEGQWGVENPYVKYKNDPQKLKSLLSKNQEAAGNMRNRIKRFMGSAPSGLKDELKDIEKRIEQIKDAMRMKSESVDLAESDNDKYTWKDINTALSKTGMDPSAIMRVLSNLKGKAIKESSELDEAAKMSAKSKEWYDKGYQMGLKPDTYKNPPYGIGGAAMDAFRKGKKAGEAAAKNEEVELDEGKDGIDQHPEVKKRYDAMLKTKPDSDERRRAVRALMNKKKELRREKEEVELDEISKKTLGSYVKKAGASMASHGVAVGSGRNTEKSSRAMANRMKGINRASDRLSKEGFDDMDAPDGAGHDPLYDIKYAIKNMQVPASALKNAKQMSKIIDTAYDAEMLDAPKHSPKVLDPVLKKNYTKLLAFLKKNEEVELGEANKGTTPARYDMIKRAAERLRGDDNSAAARRDAKRAMKSKDAQRGMAPVKTEARLDEISPKLARKAAAASGAKSFEYGNFAYDDESGKEADRLSNKADKAYAHVQKRQGDKGVRKTNRLANKLIYGRSRAFESADLKEGRNEALKALEKLANSGGMDKADFQKAHDLYKANKLNDLRKHIYRLDTSPSEEIADVIHRHDSKAFNSMYPRAKSGDYIRKIVIDHGGK